MNSKYRCYNDIVALEIICKGFKEVTATQCLNKGEQQNIQVCEPLASPCNSFDTQQQIYYSYNITPDTGYAMCTPDIGYLQSYNCTPIQDYSEWSPETLYAPSSTGNDHNERIAVARKYKHRSDFSKRRRRKYSEMERNYDCDFEGCCKSYEVISHLNTHRLKKGHGAKMSIFDFTDYTN